MSNTFLLDALMLDAWFQLYKCRLMSSVTWTYILIIDIKVWSIADTFQALVSLIHLKQDTVSSVDLAGCPVL